MPPSNSVLDSISAALNSSVININNLAANSMSEYAESNNALVKKVEIEKGLIDRQVKKQVNEEDVIKKLADVTGINLANPESIQMKLLSRASNSFAEAEQAQALLDKNDKVNPMDDPLKWLSSKFQNAQLVQRRNQSTVEGQDALTNSAALNTDFKATLENYQTFQSKISVATELERKQLAEASLAIQSSKEFQALIDPAAQTVKGQMDANKSMITTLSSIEELKNIDLHREYLKGTVAKIRRENSPEYIARQEEIINSNLSQQKQQEKLNELRLKYAPEDLLLDNIYKEQQIAGNNLKLESQMDQEKYVKGVINKANSIFERLNMPDRIDSKYALEAMPKDKQAWILGMVGKSSILEGTNSLANADVLGDNAFEAITNLSQFAQRYNPTGKEVTTLGEIRAIYNEQYTLIKDDPLTAGKKLNAAQLSANVISAINKRIEKDSRNIESGGDNNLFAPTTIKDLAKVSGRVAENRIYKDLKPILDDPSFDNKTESLAKKTIEWAKENQIPIETASKLLGEIVDEQLIHHFNDAGFAKYTLPTQKSYNVVLKGEGFFGKDTVYDLKDPAKRSAYLNEVKSRQGASLNNFNPFGGYN
jgi:hypothetical protein